MTSNEILKRYPLTVNGGFALFFRDTCPLSNWYVAPFSIKGVEFKTVEHYMMYAKAMIFDDANIAGKILNTATPREAKALGRKVGGYDDAIWAERRIGIVATGARAKFYQHPELKAFLLATAGLELVEASPYDRLWGIGLAATDARATVPAMWLGQNLLGKTLTRLRDLILTQELASTATPSP